MKGRCTEFGVTFICCLHEAQSRDFECAKITRKLFGSYNDEECYIFP